MYVNKNIRDTVFSFLDLDDIQFALEEYMSLLLAPPVGGLRYATPDIAYDISDIDAIQFNLRPDENWAHLVVVPDVLEFPHGHYTEKWLRGVDIIHEADDYNVVKLPLDVDDGLVLTFEEQVTTSAYFLITALKFKAHQIGFFDLSTATILDEDFPRIRRHRIKPCDIPVEWAV